MRYFGFKKRSFGLKTIGWAGSTAFTLANLFKNGEQGVWLDPSDLKTMFQDVAGTVPVTKDGNPVALIKDKSGNGNHATQETASARPIYRTDGILHWLEFDGVDDWLYADLKSPILKSTNWAVAVQIHKTTAAVVTQYDRSSSRFTLLNHGGETISGYFDGNALTRSSTNSDTLINVFNTEFDIVRKSVVMFKNGKRSEGTRAPSTGGSVNQRFYVGQRGDNLFYANMNLYGLVRVDDVNTSRNVAVDIHLADKAGIKL